jgi:xanthine/CO dehydrogenase XdhC/CoxF family maturation factor
MWLSTSGTFALARLAHHYGVTQRELIERMALAEDERVFATIASGIRRMGQLFWTKAVT